MNRLSLYRKQEFRDIISPQGDIPHFIAEVQVISAVANPRMRLPVIVGPADQEFCQRTPLLRKGLQRMMELKIFPIAVIFLISHPLFKVQHVLQHIHSGNADLKAH